MENKAKYRKLIRKAEFMMFTPIDDHVVLIKKAGYTDIEIYYVIVEDAYRTPTMEILSSDDIFQRFGITKEELTEI